MNRLKNGIGVVGSTTIDKIITDEDSFLKLGGVTTYAGITYRRHGIPVFIVSNMAEQDLELMGKLSTEKTLVVSAKSELSTVFINHNRGGTHYQELQQQARSIEIGQIRSILDRIDGLHLGPLHPLDIEAGALRFLQNSNLEVFLDVQGYTRLINNKKVYRCVSAQIAKANEAEYNAILSFYQMTLEQLVHYFGIKEFVVTLGDKGGFVQKQNGEVFRYDPAMTHTPVDPTGAGDVFLAAYIASRYVAKKNVPDACTWAAKIAAHQVAGEYITIEELGI